MMTRNFEGSNWKNTLLIKWV